MSSSGKASSSGDDDAGRLPALPDYLLDNIVNRLEDAREIARVSSVCRELRRAGRNVESIRIICSDEYHERARNNSDFHGKSFRLKDSGPNTPGSSSGSYWKFLSFKEVVVGILTQQPQPQPKPKPQIEMESMKQNPPIVQLQSEEEFMKQKPPIVQLQSEVEFMKQNPPIVQLHSEEESMKRNPPVVQLQSEVESMKQNPPIGQLHSEVESMKQNPPIGQLHSEEESMKQNPPIVQLQSEAEFMKQKPPIVQLQSEEESVKQKPPIVQLQSEAEFMKQKPPIDHLQSEEKAKLQKLSIVQLRIEVESKLQSKSVDEGERRRTDFWLTDHYFVLKWLPGLGHSLKHLCIVDYGQQAIMRRSKIVKLLSENCKFLETLDLRNLFIETSDIEVMLNMVSLTLRCVKVVAQTLQHLNENMPRLQTLALLGVFGAEGGKLEFQSMKVLCLGLSTPAKFVIMNCPNLEKLQLKMQCPENLVIMAQNLKYVAFNLDVMEPSKVELISMVGLEELLYGATSFVTLSFLVERNCRNLKKLFLDIPCMALAEDGSFLGVVKDISLQQPSFNKLSECKELEVLNVGPGLWYSMETQVDELLSTQRWPSMKSLVLHMIPHDIEEALRVLRILLRFSVTSLDVFIHESSPITKEVMFPRIDDIVQNCNQSIDFKIHSWKKSLNFSCFSF